MRGPYTKTEPEGPWARREPKPPTTLSPSGSGAPSNLCVRCAGRTVRASRASRRSSRGPGERPLRVSPGIASRRSRQVRARFLGHLARLADRISRPSRRSPDPPRGDPGVPSGSSLPTSSATWSEAKDTDGPCAGQHDGSAGQRSNAQVAGQMERVTIVAGVTVASSRMLTEVGTFREPLPPNAYRDPAAIGLGDPAAFPSISSR